MLLLNIMKIQKKIMFSIRLKPCFIIPSIVISIASLSILVVASVTVSVIPAL
jgi:hypothetical protein